MMMIQPELGTSDNTSIMTEAPKDQLVSHWSHVEHPLVLQQLQATNINTATTDDQKLICNGCVMPIISTSSSEENPLLFYSCNDCNFFIHKFCTNLPRTILPGVVACHPEHTLDLFTITNTDFVTCELCDSAINGICYYCTICECVFDVRCCFVPNRIKHHAHKHPLTLSHCDTTTTSGKYACRACGFIITTKMEFRCEPCKFNLHIRCALFPAMMRHRWDPHPLQLMYPPFYDHGGEIYCEICEKEMDLNRWMYNCSNCDQSFHPECLVGRHNVKTGGKAVALDQFHPHPLTFVVKRVVDGQRFCGGCGVELMDFQPLLECAACDFLLCPRCG